MTRVYTIKEAVEELESIRMEASKIPSLPGTLSLKAKENGLEEHIRRIGTRILIDENGFWDWIDKKGSEWR